MLFLMVDDGFIPTHQSSFKAIYQGLFSKWLAQECYCARCQRLIAGALVRKARNKDSGWGRTIGDETTIKLDATQARHMHVGDQTRGVINAIRIEEIFGRRVGGRHVAKGSKQASNCLTDAFIIVDYRNHENLWEFGSTMAALAAVTRSSATFKLVHLNDY